MNILTFDIEDWFHILDNPSTKLPKTWDKFETRVKYGLDIILEIVQQNDVKATFFVLGWIAKKYPEIVRLISDMDFEIASHTYSHQLVYEQNKTLFYSDVEKSIKILEDISGNKIKSFRAPGFSIGKDNLWAFDVLIDLGIKYDSSVFTASRSHGGFGEEIYETPFLINSNNIYLKEFPINNCSFFNQKIVFSGGGYFRFLPFSITNYLMGSSNYNMTYFHPRDFDSNQPMIPGLSLARRFKCYVGIKSCKNKLDKILKNHKFTDISTANDKIDWSKANSYLL